MLGQEPEFRVPGWLVVSGAQGTALQRRNLEPLQGRAKVRVPGIVKHKEFRTLRGQ